MLGTLNEFLTRIGLVLLEFYDVDDITGARTSKRRYRLLRWSTYERRIAAEKES